VERGPKKPRPAGLEAMRDEATFTAIIRALPTGALLFLAAAAVHAQTSGIIQGVIKDDSGQAVSSVYAVAVNPAIGGKQYTAVTDNVFGLYNNAATAGSSAAPGSATVLSNSQCSLSAAQSTVSGSGNNLVVSFAITFAASFAGTKNNLDATLVCRARANRPSAPA
jgi:hypothetical protein